MQVGYFRNTNPAAIATLEEVPVSINDTSVFNGAYNLYLARNTSCLRVNTRTTMSECSTISCRTPGSGGSGVIAGVGFVGKDQSVRTEVLPASRIAVSRYVQDEEPRPSNTRYTSLL